jgi:cytochrome b involved in lipid metabolism
MYEHPGGSSKLMQRSGTGKDYIEDFEAEEHSKSAINKLKKFYIGDVK